MNEEIRVKKEEEERKEEEKMLKEMEYVGVMGIELLVMKEGKMIENEFEKSVNN